MRSHQTATVASEGRRPVAQELLSSSASASTDFSPSHFFLPFPLALALSLLGRGVACEVDVATLKMDKKHKMIAIESLLLTELSFPPH